MPQHGLSSTRTGKMGPTNQWHYLMGCIAKLIGNPNSTELAALRAEIFALKQENLHLKYQLEARGEPDELARQAYIDYLTGLPNRRALHCAAAREMARARRSRRPICVVLADIDHFKAINDDFGHAQGDAVLRAIAATLSAHIRITDTVAHWGGEEFALLLPETDLAAAGIVAEKCRLAVQALTTNLPCSITMTLGVSEIHPSDLFEAALERADCAMYAGKKRGRNRVVLT
jgi:diguanylate cyclase (GGDEF)-like protein